VIPGKNAERNYLFCFDLASCATAFQILSNPNLVKRWHTLEALVDARLLRRCAILLYLTNNYFARGKKEEEEHRLM
jgi:hypothetical protein